jgi:alpha-beta hydrolase superfamily lysophospholipase
MRLRRITKRLLGWGAVLLAVGLLGVLVLRSLGATRGPQLEAWHQFAPDEWSVSQMDRASWRDWIRHEERVFQQVRDRLGTTAPGHRPETLTRYTPGSIVNPNRFARDWNRSFEMEPDGAPRGVAVMLHGMTDSPYSLRHLALHYRDRGFLVIAIRMPGHGTTPAGLVTADYDDWLAATRLAMREAARRRPGSAPLHIVGYSNGAALALLYALEADGSASQPLPTRLVLLSPMIGVDAYARFAGIAGLPALLPPFAKAAWLDVLPEFNPFKYNSFPVHAARESWVLTDALQSRLAEPARAARLPPVLAFASVLDATVTASAVITRLFDRLPANGSELVLYDVNHAAYFKRLVRPAAIVALEQLLPQNPVPYGITAVTTKADPRAGAWLRQRAPGTLVETSSPLGIAYPSDMYSLSHIALPFPPEDSLYGSQPAVPGEFGLALGTITPRGERGVLEMGLDALLRASSNPFYAYQLARIDETLPAAAGPAD